MRKLFKARKAIYRGTHVSLEHPSVSHRGLFCSDLSHCLLTHASQHARSCLTCYAGLTQLIRPMVPGTDSQDERLTEKTRMKYIPVIYVT